jgi:hypothetical protein
MAHDRKHGPRVGCWHGMISAAGLRRRTAGIRVVLTAPERTVRLMCSTAAASRSSEGGELPPARPIFQQPLTRCVVPTLLQIPIGGRKDKVTLMRAPLMVVYGHMV